MASVYNLKKLLFTYLPDDMTDDGLMELVRPFGNVLEANTVPRNRPPGAPNHGYAFVEFDDQASAAKAMKQLDGLLMMKRCRRETIETRSLKTIKVTYARENTPEIRDAKVCVYNFPTWWNEDDIEEFFGQFGKIIQCRFLDQESSFAGKSDHVVPSAFVLYDLHEQAQRAIKECSLEGDYFGMGITVRQYFHAISSPTPLRD